MRTDLRSAAHALGGEVRAGRIYAPGPNHSAADRSMWILFDWQAPDGFVIGSFSGDPFDVCRDHVRALLGMEPWKPGRDRPDSLSVQPKTKALADHSGEFEKRRRIALDVWSNAKPLVATIGEKYLIRRIGRALEWPTDLRFHPRCARKTKEGFEYCPAVIVLLRDIDSDEPRAIQRIFLRPDGSDRLRDAMGKATLGQSAGCACKLSPDSDVAGGLGIIEGVEKGLSLLALGWAPIWATCGTSGLSSFPALSGVESLTIFADADIPGQNAAQHCASRWNDAGAAVRIATPKTQGADWSDALGAAT